MRAPRSLVSLVAVLCASSTALAADRDEAQPGSPGDDDALWAVVERPWLYQPDPSAPPPGHLIAGLSVGYASVNRGAARPFAADLAHAGAVYTASAEVGVHRVFSLQAEGLLAGEGTCDSVSAGAVLGASLHPLPPGVPVDLSVSAGYLRELGGSSGVWGRAAIAGDLGPARLALTALGEHVFEPGRDGVDVLVTTGVSFAVAEPVRIGVEYVVQDLEGAWDPEEADGGIRHFVGPNIALELMRHRARLVAGPALGLSDASPRLLGRVAAIYSF